MKKYLLVVLFISGTITGFAQIPNYVPTTGLESWWSFDGNANDIGPSGNNFTNNGATLTTDRFSNSNSAYDFNGSNQYLTLFYPSFTFGQTSVFTVSFWVQRSSLGYGVTMIHGNWVNGNFIWAFQSGPSGDFQFGTNKQGLSWFWAASTYTTSTWEHFVGVYNNGAMTFYKNGVQVSTDTNTYTSVGSINLPFYLGKGVNGAYFDGKIDDLGIWTRALTASEIDELFAACAVITGHPKDTIARIGNDLKLGVTATHPNTTYQWQMANGGGWWDLNNSGQFSGTDTDSLLISNLTIANDVALFKCIVNTNSNCADTSYSGFLRVCGQITVHPRDTMVSSATQTVVFHASNNSQAASYQWQTDTGSGFVNIIDNWQYTGASTPSLSISNLTTNNAGQKLRCTTYSGIFCTDTSAEATLTIGFVSQEEESSNQLLSIYPNPAKDVINVKVDGSLSNENYVIINSMGQIIDEGEIMEIKGLIELSKFAPGYYTLEIGELRKTFVINK